MNMAHAAGCVTRRPGSAVPELRLSVQRRLDDPAGSACSLHVHSARFEENIA
jgi:hypothetical protein